MSTAGPDPVPAADGAGPSPAVRRAPFSANPDLGHRGQRTRQRILDAALEAFGERGYHRTGVAQITRAAGCSRASFYQYFAGKEEVYRQLTGQVARQLSASVEALRPLTPDAAGWASVREWVGRHGEVHARYRPVFAAFGAAAEADAAVVPGARRSVERNVARLRAKVGPTDLPTRKLDPVIALLEECVTRVHEVARSLRAVAPEGHPPGRLEDALADVVHRSLFGLCPLVNVRPPLPGPPPPVVRFAPATRASLRAGSDGAGGPELTAAGRRTLDALLRAGRDAFVARGYHGTRVDDVVDAAGVSHGAFYRYFRGKDDLARVLAGRAMRHVATVLAQVPDVADPAAGPAAGDDAAALAALRRWLRRYNASQAGETAMLQVWIDAAHHDRALEHDSAAALDWGRRALAGFLAPRGFGDAETDATVLVALLGAFGSRARPAPTVDAAALVVLRGLLGRGAVTVTRHPTRRSWPEEDQP